MSDVLIRNVPIPKENEDGVILIEFRNGKARYFNTESEIETVVLPPHGRVIDVDAFIESEKGRVVSLREADNISIRMLYERITNAPTILEASE